MGASYAPGLSSKYPLKEVPPQVMIFIDADAITAVTEVKKQKGELEFFKYIPSSVAYQLRKRSKVCIIGAGGGFDILTALSAGDAEHVTGVELNGDIVDVVADHVKAFAGDLYGLPNVRLEITEGRSYIRNFQGTFDIIHISLVDTWAAASTGAYSLAENYLYTKEAFIDYIDHLSPDGILTVTRWLLVPPKECLRLAALAITSLEDIGVENPENNIVFVGSGKMAALLLKREAFRQSEVIQIQELCEKYGLEILYAPGINNSNIFSKFIYLENKNLFYDLYPLNIEPPTDDKPFYFHYYTWNKIRLSKLSDLLFSWYKNDVSYLILITVLLQAVIPSALFILAPLGIAGKTEISKSRLRWRFLLYFGCLGMGFMFIEVTLIQKFILFLGHPVYSLSVVLSSLLIFAGLGSLFISDMNPRSTKRLLTILGILSGVVLAYSFVLPRLSYIFLGLPLIARFVISVLLLAPLGFLMGMPFPIGVRMASDANPRLVPWAWGVNGCLSVISSVLSVIIAMSFGFSVVLKFAAIVYLFAMFFIYREFFSDSPRHSLESA